MDSHVLAASKARKKRSLRVRKHLKGTSTKPRMCVMKSNMHLSIQLIDDEAGVTLASIGTTSKQYKNTEFNRKSKQSAKVLGEHIARLAKEANVLQVIFDRGPYKYHGILAELANAARASGLQF